MTFNFRELGKICEIANLSPSQKYVALQYKEQGHLIFFRTLIHGMTVRLTIPLVLMHWQISSKRR